MVFGRGDVAGVLEHKQSRAARWLRESRVKIALWIAVVEGVLVVFDVVPKWTALIVGAILIAFWFAVGRTLRSSLARDTSWIAATSQAFVALVPFLVFIVGTLALIAVGILAVVALVVLFGDRR
jgi:hypothetical protein